MTVGEGAQGAVVVAARGDETPNLYLAGHCLYNAEPYQTGPALVAALLGAVGALVGGVALVGVAVLLVGAGALIAYQRTRSTDPGMTTEFALVLTCLLGALAMRDALLNWPARVSGLIAAEISVDPHLLQTILQSHINDLLTEAADRFDPTAIGGDRTSDA